MSRMIEEMDDVPRAGQFAAQIDKREKLLELPKGTRMDGTPEGEPWKDPVMERALDSLAEKMRESGVRIASPNTAPRNDREDEGHMEDARKDESRPRCGMLKADVPEIMQNPASVRQRVTRKDVWIVGHWIMMQREGERCSLAFLREPCVLKGTRDEAQGIVHEIIAELEEALDAMGDGEEAR